jgi:hypothetical protein
MIMKEWLELWGYNWICIGTPQACKRFGKCHSSNMFLILSFFTHVFSQWAKGVHTRDRQSLRVDGQI